MLSSGVIVDLVFLGAREQLAQVLMAEEPHGQTPGNSRKEHHAESYPQALAI